MPDRTATKLHRSTPILQSERQEEEEGGIRVEKHVLQGHTRASDFHFLEEMRVFRDGGSVAHLWLDFSFLSVDATTPLFALEI